MSSDVGEKFPNIPWPWLVVTSVLIIGVAVFGPPIYVTYSSGSLMNSPALLFLVLFSSIYTPIVVLLITGILIAIVKIFEGPRVSYPNQVRIKSHELPDNWRPGFWQWVGISCLAFMLIMVLIFVNEFNESFWGNLYWASLMAGLPRLLPFLYTYAFWCQRKANYVRKTNE